jgi:bacterioferritin-associated ferredoxin
MSKVVCNLSKLGEAMIVCSCNVLSDRDVRETVTTRPDRPTVASVFRNMGCEAKCGRCVRSIVAIVDQHSAARLDESGGNGDCDSCRADGLAA